MRIKLILIIVVVINLTWDCKTVHLKNEIYVTPDQFINQADANRYLGRASQSRIEMQNPAPAGSPIFLKGEKSYLYAHSNLPIVQGDPEGETNINVITNRSFKIDLGVSLKLANEQKENLVEIEKNIVQQISSKTTSKSQNSIQKQNNPRSITKSTSMILPISLKEQIKNQEFAIEALKYLQTENVKTDFLITKILSVTKFDVGFEINNNNIKSNSCGFFGLKNDEPNAFVTKAFKVNSKITVESSNNLSAGFKASWKDLSNRTKNNATISVLFENGTGGEPDKYYILANGSWSAVEVETFNSNKCK